MQSLNEISSSSDELKAEIFNLRNEKDILIKKLDDITQQLHETKRQLTTSKLMEKELSAELESFSNETKSLKCELFKTMTLLKDVQHLKQIDSDRIVQLENELEEKQIEINNLNEKIINHVNKDDDSKKDNIDQLNQQVYELNLKIENLSLELYENRLYNEEISKKNILLENKVTVSTFSYFFYKFM